MKIVAYTDGGSRGNPGAAAIGCVLFDENETVLHEISKYIGIATNNEAEYQAVIAMLDWIKSSQEDQKIELTVYLDSKLVVEQVSKRWKIKEARMQVYAAEVWNIAASSVFKSISFNHVPREKNKHADKLVNMALDAQS